MGVPRGFHARRRDESIKIRRCGCFYSPIRCETVEILFNFIGGELVCDLVSELGGEEEEEGAWEGRIQGDAGRMRIDLEKTTFNPATPDQHR